MVCDEFSFSSGDEGQGTLGCSPYREFYPDEEKTVSVQKRIWCFEKEDVTLSPVILNVSKMYSDKDFQTFWFRYKTEGEPHGISINSFCINQGVPYKQFYAWFKKHAKDTVIPVEIEGAPADEETDDVEVPPQPASKPKTKKSKGGILITIQTTDGLFVKKGGLD